MAAIVDDRRRSSYEDATAIDQDMLDETFRCGVNQLEAVGVLTKYQTAPITVSIASPAVVTHTAHGLAAGTAVMFKTSGDLPTGLTAGATYYVKSPTTDTYQLSATSGGSAINTSGAQFGDITVAWAIVTLRFADRPKFVGDDFYEGRAKFNPVERTIGELQAPTIKFAQFEVTVANMDGFYNAYLEGGASYVSFIGARLEIKFGLRDLQSSFTTVFDGTVPDEDGFEVLRESIRIRATDKFDELNKRPDLPAINDTDFPTAPADSLGKLIPFPIGDWEAGFNVIDDAGTITVTDGVSNVAVKIAQPNSFYGGLVGYHVGGGFFVFAVGTYTPDNVSACYVKRGNTLIMANFDATPDNTAGYWSAEVTSLKGDPSGTVTYVYQSGDVAVIKVKVPYDTGKYSHPIEIAEQLLMRLAGRASSDFDSASWTALKAKNTPAQSDLTSIKSRIWIGDEKQSESVLSLVLGLLECVRVEMYVDFNGKLALRTLHPEDFPAPASADARVDQADIDERSATLKADERTFFNQASLNFAFTPVTKKTELSTPQMRNQNSINRSGKTVIKTIDAPWLYVANDAQLQLIEFVRLYSAGLGYFNVQVCWRHLLRDLGDFLAINYDVGGLAYSEAPMQIRDISIDLANAGLTYRLLNLANFAYTGYAPSNADRFLSSASQSITEA